MDDMAALSVKERVGPVPCLDRLLLFLGTLHRGWSSFTMQKFILDGYILQKTKERMLLITLKKRIFADVKGKVIELVKLNLGKFSIDFRKLL